MTKVVRAIPGKVRPRPAPGLSIYVWRPFSELRERTGRRWRRLRASREARRDAAPSKHWWKRWTLTVPRSVRWAAWAGAALLLVWVGVSTYTMTGGKTFHFLEDWQRHHTEAFDTLAELARALLLAALGTTVFLVFRYRSTKRPIVRKAMKCPRELVPTAGTILEKIVGRKDLSQVIARALRDRRTRRPYLLVGGVGSGKTAVLVRLTQLLAEAGAVPVPIHLRSADGDLDFRALAKARFVEELDRYVLSSGHSERVWRQLCRDDKLVVIADGLEEAVSADDKQDIRDNLIRQAIHRADEQRLPLVIASRPHAPLEATDAAIVELEPLSEEAALRYLEEDDPDPDEHRLDWIVETADVMESPIYLQIARQLSRQGRLEHLALREDGSRLDTRSFDRATLRLRLLETWRTSIVDGHLHHDLALTSENREEAAEVMGGLACIGLLRDSLDVDFDELLDPPYQFLEPDGRIWNALRERVTSLRHATTKERSRSLLALHASRAENLGLVAARGNGVRFPHSIIQAYLGFRMLREIVPGIGPAGLEKFLHEPGPGRELLIALVLLSRDESFNESFTEHWLAGMLLDEVKLQNRTDAKAFDLCAAALEIDCVVRDPIHARIARVLADRWTSITAGDPRTLDEAKLALVHCFGAALRTVSLQPAGKPAYDSFFEICKKEASYPIRLAIAQEMGAGGDAAFDELRSHIRTERKDPVAEYEYQLRRLEAEDHQQYENFVHRAEERDADLKAELERAGRDQSAAECQRKREADRREHAKWVAQRMERHSALWREFAMRAWLVPMLVGSVSERFRDQAEERLDLWLKHVDSAHDRCGQPALPLSLEGALALGFKSAANRRKRHPNTNDEARDYLVKQAELMLKRARYWYSHLTLLHALCLWELPDCVGREPVPDTAVRVPEAGVTCDATGSRKTRPRTRPADPVKSVARWLSTIGSPDGDRRLHPFVAEAGDLVALALETRHPERFIWIDEKGVMDRVGSHAAGPSDYRKHNLWIATSVGWSTLHPRAQRLVADVQLLLNLAERNAQPIDLETRLARANRLDLPPCLTDDRSALQPEHTVGMAERAEPGSACLKGCPFELCPYPPKGEQPRAELKEHFCRQQQALLHNRFGRRPKFSTRRTASWQGTGVRNLDEFWEKMAVRTRR